MDRPGLNDPDGFPTDAVLGGRLGPAKPAWDAFMALLQRDHPGITVAWRYYNDGKSWLLKAVRKPQTVCWVSVWEGFFKVSFYFTARAEAAFRASSLPESVKNSFLHPAAKGKLRPVSNEIRKESDLEAVAGLIQIKLSAR